MEPKQQVESRQNSQWFQDKTKNMLIKTKNKENKLHQKTNRPHPSQEFKPPPAVSKHKKQMTVRATVTELAIFIPPDQGG